MLGGVPAGDPWIYVFLREQSPGKDERAVCPPGPASAPALPLHGHNQQPGLSVVAPAGAGHALRTQLELPGKDPYSGWFGLGCCSSGDSWSSSHPARHLMKHPMCLSGPRAGVRLHL